MYEGLFKLTFSRKIKLKTRVFFSTEFALRMMGDIQEFFIQNAVKNFYSVSISGYHIAEAGANPITQLATLAMVSPTLNTT